MRVLRHEGNEGNLFFILFEDIYVGNKSACQARRNPHAGAKIRNLRWGSERFKMGRQIALIALIAF